MPTASRTMSVTHTAKNFVALGPGRPPNHGKSSMKLSFLVLLPLSVYGLAGVWNQSCTCDATKPSRDPMPAR